MTYPVFASGDVLNASDMNAVGLWLIKTQTIGSAVSTVTVTSAFSSDYDNYFVTVSGGVASQDNNLTIQLGSTNTGYYQWQTYGVYSSATVNGDAVNNGSSFTVGRGNANTLQAAAWLMGPNLAKRTVCFAQRIGAATTSTITFSTVGAFQDTDTQYTAFTLGTNAGTMTGGTIRVYGFRN
jgi:hypothetical protein